MISSGWLWVELAARIVFAVIVVVTLALLAQLFMDVYVANSIKQEKAAQLERKYYEMRIQEMEARLQKEAPPDEQ